MGFRKIAELETAFALPPKETHSAITSMYWSSRSSPMAGWARAVCTTSPFARPTMPRNCGGREVLAATSLM